MKLDWIIQLITNEFFQNEHLFFYDNHHLFQVCCDDRVNHLSHLLRINLTKNHSNILNLHPNNLGIILLEHLKLKQYMHHHLHHNLFSDHSNIKDRYLHKEGAIHIYELFSRLPLMTCTRLRSKPTRLKTSCFI